MLWASTVFNGTPGTPDHQDEVGDFAVGLRGLTPGHAEVARWSCLKGGGKGICVILYPRK
jgi:hypothetical protein